MMKKKTFVTLIVLVGIFLAARHFLNKNESAAAVWELPESADYTPVSSSHSYEALKDDTAREVYKTIEKYYCKKPQDEADGDTYLMYRSSKTEMEDEPLFLAHHAFDDDHPEAFWLETGAYRAFGLGAIDSIYVGSCYSPEELETKKAEFAAAIEKFLSSVPKGLTAEELEKYTHDYLISTCEYDYDALEHDSIEAHSAYGALVKHKAVCSGYARAYQVLLNRLGIECVPVYGNGQPVAENEFGVRMGRSDHEWNAVKNGSVWLMTDVTWDDIDDMPGQYDPSEQYHYFNISASEMYQDHKAYLIDQENFFYSPMFTANSYGDCLFLPD